MIKIINGKTDPEQIFARTENKVDVSGVVTEIIDTVRKNGDKALFEYAKKFDKAELDSLAVTKEEIEDAVSSIDQKFFEVLKNDVMAIISTPMSIT